MNDPIKVLVVDDNRADADLAMRELRRSGNPFELCVATHEREYRSALAEFAPDIILSDFSLPDFDGSTAVRIAHEVVPGTPVVFVSRTISEERAAIAVRNGAADYVLKRNLNRLPDAVTRAMGEAREEARQQAAVAELEASRERLTALLENVDSVLSSFSLGEMRYYYLSPAVRRVYGRSAEDFDRDDSVWRDVVHPDDLERFLAARETLQNDGAVELEYRVVHPDGDVRWVNQRSKVAYDAHGSATRIDTIGTDITERMEQQRQVERLSRMRNVFAAVNSAIVRIAQPAALCQETCKIATTIGGFPVAAVILIDTATGEGRVEASTGESSSEVARRMLRASIGDLEHARGILADSLRAKRPVIADDLETPALVEQELEPLLRVGVQVFGSFPFEIDDTHIGTLLLGAIERDFFSDDEVELVASLTNNLSFALELASKRNRLDYLAYYDPLTELPNRTLAQDRLGLEIAAAERRGDRLALLVFDLRQFADVNSTLGEATGDDVLRALARRLLAETGPTRVARVAGDRFAILIPELRAVRDVATTLSVEGLALLAEPLDVAGRPLRLTAHVGCAVYPNDGTDAKTLLQNAEAALQSAKGSEAPYRFYDPKLNARLRRRLDLEARLRRAATDHEFILYYQPKVELGNRAITGVEALIRWQDPERPHAPVPPGEFIPVLEETGLITEVGRWAIGEAVRQYRSWVDSGLAAPRIAVNVSAVQLGDGDLVDEITSAIHEFPGESGLDIEVTESGLMANVGEAIVTLRRIRELGVGIALDDFGTGYSSLSYLFQLPVSSVKIDRSFINDMTTDADKLTIISTVISLGRDLKLQVIAEGVETEDQAKLLALLRCDQIQGFLIGRPMPSEDLALLLKPC